jgi:hypothetical protein
MSKPLQMDEGLGTETELYQNLRSDDAIMAFEDEPPSATQWKILAVLLTVYLPIASCLHLFLVIMCSLGTDNPEMSDPPVQRAVRKVYMSIWMWINISLFVSSLVLGIRAFRKEASGWNRVCFLFFGYGIALPMGLFLVSLFLLPFCLRIASNFETDSQ